MRWGDHLQFTAEADPGDFIFAINLDIEPVEKPQTVLWVDPIPVSYTHLVPLRR